MQTLLRRHAGLVAYTALNYLDKGFAVAVPLIVLWTTRDQILYNQLEYLYSIGALAVVVLELGVRNYLLFGYREARERDRFMADGHNHFLLLNLIYATVSLALAALLAALGWGSPGLWLLMVVRALYSGLFNFYSILVRLEDRPSAVFALSLGANGGTCLLVALFWWLGWRLTLPMVFLTQALLILGLVILAIRRRLWQQVGSLFTYLGRTLAYAWPIILNVFLVVAIQNTGKLYAQNALSPDEMTRISMAQRMTMVIHLGHGSAIGYLSKRIFMDSLTGVNSKVLGLYSGMVGLGVLLAVLAVLLLGVLIPGRLSISDPVLWVLVAYTMAWCFVSFIELYVNKANHNRYVPLFTVIGSGFFLVTLALPGQGTLLKIVVAMLMGMIANLLLMIWFLRVRLSGPSRSV